MTLFLDREFATAEDTAAALGVSKARLKRLLKIAGPESRMVARNYKAARNGSKRVSPAKNRSRRKPTRGKAKKASH